MIQPNKQFAQTKKGTRDFDQSNLSSSSFFFSLHFCRQHSRQIAVCVEKLLQNGKKKSQHSVYWTNHSRDFRMKLDKRATYFHPRSLPVDSTHDYPSTVTHLHFRIHIPIYHKTNAHIKLLARHKGIYNTRLVKNRPILGHCESLSSCLCLAQHRMNETTTQSKGLIMCVHGCHESRLG